MPYIAVCGCPLLLIVFSCDYFGCLSEWAAEHCKIFVAMRASSLSHVFALTTVYPRSGREKRKLLNSDSD